MAYRDELAIEMDRSEIASLMRKGYRTPKQLANAINSRRESNFISEAQVRNDIAVLKQEMKDQRFEDLQIARNERLEDLYDAKREAWEAYLRSMMPKRTIESEDIVNEEVFDEIKLGFDEGDDRYKRFLKKVKIKEESRPEGNHAFLTLMAQIDDKIARHKGADTPDATPLLNEDDDQGTESPLEQLVTALGEMNLPKQLTEGSSENNG